MRNLVDFELFLVPQMSTEIYSFLQSQFIQIRSAQLRVFLSLVTLLPCGCSGGGESSAPPSGGTIPPPPVVIPVSATPAKPAKKKTSKKPKKNSTAEEQTILTSNDYQIEAPPGDEVISPDDVPEQNYFAVIEPVGDSSLMTVEVPEETTSNSSQSKDLGLDLPDGFAVAANSNYNDQGFPTKIVCEGDGSQMVLIEGGVFTRGSNLGPADVQPEQHVFISPFYMDTHEVTVGQFQKFRTEFNEEASKSSKARAPGNASQEENFPALNIVWRDAENYAKEYGKELPTEAEWERAARGEKSHQYPWGNGRPLATSTPLEEILPVGSRVTDLTPTGLFDMAGNAEEWTADWYSADLYSKQAKNSKNLIRNPSGPRLPDKLGEKSTRGSQGTWNLWLRSHANLRQSGTNVGFRCILRISDEMIISENE